MDESVRDYGLGRLPAVDERDAGYRMASVLPSDAPTRTYRYWTPQRPTLDQGRTSSCVGQAWSQWAGCGPIRNIGVDPYDVYEASQRIDEWPGEAYDGTSVRAGAKVMQGRGIISSYVWGDDAETVGAFILTTGPVVLGTRWFGKMFYPDERGFVVPEGWDAGGHAYLATGYSRTRGVFRLQNSWGEAWGDSGRFWLLGEHLDQLIRDQGEACAALEVRSG